MVAVAPAPPAATPADGAAARPRPTYILVLDTETSGLPRRWGFNKFYPPSNLDCYDESRLLSLACILFHVPTATWEVYRTLVRPDGSVNIHPAATRKHGLTAERLQAEGRPFAECLPRLRELIRKANLLVCHNTGFDLSILASELYRAGDRFAAVLERKMASQSYCTLDGSRPLNQKVKDKTMELHDLYEQLTGKAPPESHEALNDTYMAVASFFCMSKDAYGDLGVQVPDIEYFHSIEQPL